MMKNRMVALCAALMAVTSVGIAPASAASTQYNGAQMTNVQYGYGNYDRNDRNDRNDRDGRFERRGNSYYYNGHRGQRDRRSGWRQFNGFWFPQAAFSFGFTISPNRGMSYSSNHRAWCDDRYISYRSSDNTFQPYNGPRQQCVSPYSR